MPAFLWPVVSWGLTAALALLASGCTPSREPPETQGKGPDEGPAGPDQLQKKPAPAQAPTPADTFRALQRDDTGLLALDADRIEKIFAQLCHGARESVEKDRASLSQEDFKRADVQKQLWPQVGQKPTNEALLWYYTWSPGGEDELRHLCKMVSVDPMPAVSWFRMARYLEARKEPEKSRQAYDVADAMGRLQGDRVGLSFSMLASARRYLNQGETFRAIDLYEAVLNIGRVSFINFYPRLPEELEEKWPENVSNDRLREFTKRLKE